MLRSEWIIRQAIPADVPEVQALWQEMMVFHQDRDGYFRIRPDAAANFSAYISAQISRPEACVLVAVLDGRPIGYCHAVVAEYPPVYCLDRYGEIMELGVAAGHRRQGVGEAMVREIFTWFRQRQVLRVEAKVAVANELSTGFWRKQGFRPYVAAMTREL